MITPDAAARLVGALPQLTSLTSSTSLTPKPLTPQSSHNLARRRGHTLLDAPPHDALVTRTLALALACPSPNPNQARLHYFLAHYHRPTMLCLLAALGVAPLSQIAAMDLRRSERELSNEVR